MRFEGARGRRSNRKRIVLIWAVSFAFSVGRNLSSPSANAISVGALEGVVGLGDYRARIVQGLALATTVGGFTLLEETPW